MSPLQATLETLEIEPLEVVTELPEPESEEIVLGEDTTPDILDRIGLCCSCCCCS